MEYPAGFDHVTLAKKPICGVLAVAIAANVSYPAAFAVCKALLPKHCSRFRGATYNIQRDKALTRFGISYKPWLPIGRVSVIKFCEYYAEPGITYLLEVRGHVLTLKNGFLIDQRAIIPWQQYPHPRKKLHRVVKINGSVWP